MNASFRNRQLPYSNPLANALVIIVGVLTIGVLFVVGLMAFVVLAAVVAVLVAVIGIRVWWLRRKLGGKMAAPQARQSESITVIEGEYEVIPGQKDRQNPPQS